MICHKCFDDEGYSEQYEDCRYLSKEMVFAYLRQVKENVFDDIIAKTNKMKKEADQILADREGGPINVSKFKRMLIEVEELEKFKE